jgi:hypothetical protein
VKSKSSLRGLARLTSPQVSSADARAKARATSGSLASSASGLELIRINVETQGSYVIRKLEALGLTDSAAAIGNKLDKLSAKILNKMADSALSAVRSKVPVHYWKGGVSARLRNTHIHSTGSPYSGPHTAGRFKSGSPITLSRDIYVDNKQHIVPYRRNRLTASSLADFKESVGQRRSGPSIAEGGYTASPKGASSQNWIGLAKQEFNSRKGAILNRILGEGF